MGFARSITLVWPGLPWLWLRGSVGGLVLALAFAVLIDTAIVTTWIWSELVDLQVSIGIWTAVAAIWLAGTVSAASAFPAAIPRSGDAAADRLLATARDAYLARDWLSAEKNLRAALSLAPTDGEAQLLLATLLRRVGRGDEARAALEKLSRSDSGAPWRTEIARERVFLDHGGRADAASGDSPAAAGSPGSKLDPPQARAA